MAWLTDVLERVISGQTRAHELHTPLPSGKRARPPMPPTPHQPWRHDAMIDHPDRAGRLFERLGAALPIPARPTPELQATLRKQRDVSLPADCRVTWISYAGDEAGIVCKLEGSSELTESVFTSITHLRFDPRLPFASEILAYQKHRVKRLRQQFR